jgi:putative glutamine amidotransferase
MKKNIAVSAEIEYPGKPQMKRAVINDDYVQYVKIAGAHPWPVYPGMRVQSIVDKMDGLLLTGGKDISPLMFGDDLDKFGAAGCCLERDMFERALYDAFLKAGKPIFGICRGFQLIGQLCGLSLVQEINSYKEVTICHNQGAKDIPGDNPVHKIACWGMVKLLTTPKDQIEERKASTMVVNSFHHQGFVMKGKTGPKDWIRAAPEVIGWARSHDEAKILEALMLHKPTLVQEDPDNEKRVFVGGVQWHPERMMRGGYQNEKHLVLFQFVMGIIDQASFADFQKEDEQAIEQAERD